MIELLVVITIILILVALLFPVLSSSSEQTHLVRCTNNLRQIGVALISFAGENDGCFPEAGATILHGDKDPTTGLPGWTEQLEKYLGTDTAVYVCPASSKALPGNAKYSYFIGCHAAYAANGGFSPLRQPLIQFPSKYILGGDISKALFEPNDTDKDDYTQNPAFAENPIPYHNAKSNILFADGHIAAFGAFDANAMTVYYDKMGGYP